MEEQLRIHNAYLKGIHELLSRQENFNEDINDLREVFAKTYYEGIRIAFDVSVKPEDLKRFSSSDKENDKFSRMSLVAKSVESQAGYEIMNEILGGFLEILERNRKM